MKRRSLICGMSVLLVSLCLFQFTALARRVAPSEEIKLNIATVDNRPLYIDRLLYTALKDIRCTATIKTAASLQQGYTLANNGERDGVVSSTPDMESIYPNLRKVPVELDYNNVVAFTRADRDLKINSWDDLAGLRVAILTQRVYIQNSIPQTATIKANETTALAFGMLSNDEADVVVLSQRAHETMNLPDDITTAGQIEVLPEYLYLHKSRAAMIPSVKEAIEGVFADGRGEKILDDIPIPEMYPRKTIIHIYSANSELAREEQFTGKLRSQFEGDDSIEWYTIALNSKGFSTDPNRLSSFANLLRQDCVSRNIAAIIVSGDDAFDFLTEHYLLFFKNTPVLFYGFGDLYDASVSGYGHYFTGISEQLSAFETAAAAIELFPDTKTLHVINDYSDEGRYYESKMKSQLSQLEKRVNIEYAENMDFEDLTEHLANLPPDDAVFIGSYFKDANEQYFSQSEMKRVLERECSVPIVTLYATDLPYNAIGGKCLDYEAYGEVIAGMLKRLLDGEPVEEIPVVSASATYNRWVFNKVIMDKMGIKEKSLPYGSQIINKKPSVWEANFEFAITTLLLLFVSAVVAILTQIYRHRDKLMQMKLRETALIAEESSRMKSIFLANMSHEIRTPMNGIIGFSELALDDNIPPRTKDYLNKIKISADGLLQIINNILDISKIEAGKIHLENIPFELHEIFKICQTITMPKASEKGIALFCYAEPAVDKRLLGDPTRLRQAILNLLSNSVKFTNSGIVKLLASVVEDKGDSITIHFEVKDSGIGMSPAQIDRIFVPFAQGDDSTTRKYGGTGLGLSITKNIVELMGGELHVESTPGVGSKFSFDLTFKTASEASADLFGEDAEHTVEKPAFDGEALICEDNEMSRQVIRDHLSRIGITSTIAVNGREGVDRVRLRMENGEKPFDIIFMDIQMPRMDGLEAARKLAALGNKTPVIALTANIMHSDRKIYEEHGMCDCLAKPFTSQALWSCLLRYLKPVHMVPVNKNEQAETDARLHERLLKNFVDDNQTTFEDINAAVNSGDLKLANRLAHTLKGVAGLIGKPELQEAARVIEHSTADGKADFSTDQMNALEFELHSALNAAAASIDNTARRTPQPGEFDKEKTAEMFDMLASQLESNSFDCLDLTDDLAMIPETEMLVEQIERFEFELARKTLDDLRKVLGV